MDITSATQLVLRALQQEDRHRLAACATLAALKVLPVFERQRPWNDRCRGLLEAIIRWFRGKANDEELIQPLLVATSAAREIADHPDAAEAASAAYAAVHTGEMLTHIRDLRPGVEEQYLLHFQWALKEATAAVHGDPRWTEKLTNEMLNLVEPMTGFQVVDHLEAALKHNK